MKNALGRRSVDVRMGWEGVRESSGGVWRSNGDRWIGDGGVGKAFWSRLGALRGRWGGDGRSGVSAECRSGCTQPT